MQSVYRLKEDTKTTGTYSLCKYVNEMLKIDIADILLDVHMDAA